jgi:RNA polymerase sigma-70 factor (ECF subfamily)
VAVPAELIFGRRSSAVRDDGTVVGAPSAVAGGRGAELLSLYDDAVGDVYGYVVARCRNREVAEDVTAEVFAAAVEAVRRDSVADLTTAWLIGIARHKLVDEWRREEREQRRLHAVADDPTVGSPTADWDVELDILAARHTLDQLGAHHRAALVLRYLDGLPVPEVAEVLGRTAHATEALLVRARRAFREIYEEVDV